MSCLQWIVILSLQRCTRRVGGVLWGIHVCHTSVLHVRDFSCVVPRHSLRFFVSTVTVVVCTTGGLLFIFSKYQRQFGRAHLPGSVKPDAPANTVFSCFGNVGPDDVCRGPYCGRHSYDRHIVMSLFFLYRVGDFIFGRLGDIISGRDIICHSPHFGRLRSTGELLV